MSGPVASLASVGPPRLLAGLHEVARLDRVAHLTQHGSLPRLRAQEVVDLAENIDLRGRGGAGFPFARKMRAVVDSARRRGGRSVVVVNGSEGEPSCLKDTALLLQAPHLVIDGAVLAATALDAEGVWIGVTRGDVQRSVQAAVDERGPTGPRVRVAMLPERFVTGESSSMINGIGTGTTLPSGRKVRSSDSGLGGLPTLFSNTETFAQLAVAARLGALEYRSAGLPAEPGTMLLTVAGSVVVETPTGVPLPYILQLCGLEIGQGVLIGGYHGTFIGPEAAWAATISRESLAAFDAVLGAGAVLPVPENTCPVGETARVARWMAGETAGQCGPCFLGLPSLADAVDEVAAGGGMAALDAVRTRIETVTKRGACSHPDGTSRFVKSALESFPEEFNDHALGRGCGRPVAGVLPLMPETGNLPVLALPPGSGASAQRKREPAEKKEKLLVDWTLCQGHGLCADIVPDVVRLGPDGYPSKATYSVPGEVRQQALRAVRRCPALALRIQN
ncbi:NADH-ubiquinone oxidoreductase-F iron-sulfur binding region domain-containing protein [Streptomyces sp. TRM 70361]|uniref:NADH-ubiquinone oxidoreductase-F iron-sulfur binding region domain-containing protein n=1 Tax=Streptomyces sp. TRM 70361 TaxID=3116553 RepID=UPI002E7B57E5|nr:NADH-ubiquinone oxidoreductase-F iron-sulfur binding region domain-containing protein [Streptomyces sp. TRM 70361]MEE1938927.1 NADH-ubiquinone oxidoreductase-F iron-sulfur binding region domain-containing protein [Streptomyces sp. TRM 70361]